MARIELENIIGKHKGKPGVVMGTGPSLRAHATKICNLSKEGKLVTFVTNDWFNHIDLKPDYWVFANNVLTVKTYHHIINDVGALVAFADTVDLTSYSVLNSILKVDYLGYDQRHFNNSPCRPKGSCCTRLVKGRDTIQEALQKLSGSKEHYSNCGTVASHMIALALLSGCNPVYFTGIDLDYSLGYANFAIPVPKDRFWNTHRDLIRRTFKIMNDNAVNLGSKLVNLNKNSWYKEVEIGELDVS